MHHYRLLLATSILAILLVACSNQPAEPVNLTVKMSEYAYSPANIEVEVGQQVTLELVNTGALAHELMIGRSVQLKDGQPNGFETDLFEAAGIAPEVEGGLGGMDAHAGEHGGHSGSFMLSLPAGAETARLTFMVTKEMVGEWEIGCFEQEGVHYAAGMAGKLIVKP